MSHDDQIRALKHTIGVQHELRDDYKALTAASRHMRAAATLLEGVTDPRALKATRLLLDAMTSLTSIDVPAVPT